MTIIERVKPYKHRYRVIHNPNDYRRGFLDCKNKVLKILQGCIPLSIIEGIRKEIKKL